MRAAHSTSVSTPMLRMLLRSSLSFTLSAQWALLGPEGVVCLLPQAKVALQVIYRRLQV